MCIRDRSHNDKFELGGPADYMVMRLLAAVKARVAAGHARFHVPGHKVNHPTPTRVSLSNTCDASFNFLYLADVLPPRELRLFANVPIS